MASPKDYAAATLKDQVGHDFGASAPVLLDQQRIDGFARCTGDDQWIHVDVERARTQSPFRNTIAHGLLLLSLIPAMHFELGVYPADALNVLNYGFEKVRFLAPVPAGTAVYLRTDTGRGEPEAAWHLPRALHECTARQPPAGAAGDGRRLARTGGGMKTGTTSTKARRKAVARRTAQPAPVDVADICHGAQVRPDLPRNGASLAESFAALATGVPAAAAPGRWKAPGAPRGPCWTWRPAAPPSSRRATTAASTTRPGAATRCTAA